MDEFERLRENWLGLVRNTKIEEANSLYWEKLFPLIEKQFLENNKLKGEYDWLILPAGLESSYYILLIKAIKPKNVYFLCTNEFKNEFLEKILNETKLKASQYIVDTLDYDEMDVADVYERIRKRLDLFYNKKVVLDLTRGKRIMSVGAGIVGAFFGFDLVYIDEEWVDEIKRGKPGTEKLVEVRNPFDVFGDLEVKEARELFNNYNYGAAIFFYKKLREKIADPRKIELEELLSEAYLHWNSFNFKAAFQKLDLLIKKSKQYSVKVDSQVYGNLKALEILSSVDANKQGMLSDEFNLHIIIDLYSNALRKAEVGMFEDSVSRLYRVLEFISQYRLRSYGIETSNPNLEKYTEEYKKIIKEIYGFEKGFPLEIGLKDGYVLLFILKDYILENYSLDDLKNIFSIIRVRDKSIIAHGIDLIGEKAFKNMQELAKKFIEKICGKQEKNMQESIKQHSFVKL